MECPLYTCSEPCHHLEFAGLGRGAHLVVAALPAGLDGYGFFHNHEPGCGRLNGKRDVGILRPDRPVYVEPLVKREGELDLLLLLVPKSRRSVTEAVTASGATLTPIVSMLGCPPT